MEFYEYEYSIADKIKPVEVQLYYLREFTNVKEQV